MPSATWPCTCHAWVGASKGMRAALTQLCETWDGSGQPHGTARLTDREVEVLRLLARGQSNKEIASSLAISPRTAQHHVIHIYQKIGVSSRAGAALFATEHDLLIP